MPPDWVPALSGTGTKLKHFLYFYFLLSLISLTDADSDCSLVGKGACRGEGWSEGQWPLGAGVQSRDDCEDLCQDKQGCTGFSLSKQGDCFLYGHQKLVPATALGGECYKCPVQEKSTAKLAQPTKEAKPKKPATDSKPAEAKPKQPIKPPKEAPKPEKKPVKDEPKAKKLEKPKETQKLPQDSKAKSQKPVPVKQEPAKSKPAAPIKTKPAENSAAKSKITEKTKKAQVQSMKVDGKYLKLIGDGGCRGKDWNKGVFPVDQGRKSLEACAKACKDNKCTAFHVLHEEKAKYDCLLFGHTNVLAVHGLGGQCYTLSDKAPTVAKATHDLTKEKEREVKGPVNMAALGPGRCRGQDWTFSYWPIIHQHLTAKECATACAKKMGCTAFDLSERDEQGKFECALYGHSKVVPAIGVPGNCYVLSDKAGELPANYAKAKPLPKPQAKPPTKVPQKSEAKPVEKKKAAPQPTKPQKVEQANKKPTPQAKPATKVEPKKATPKPVPNKETKKSDKPSKEQKKANEPAAKQEKKPKASSKTTGPISGKFIVSVGEGGCRGTGWDKGVWPVIAGKRLKNACATMCLSNGCTAFHILHEEKGLYDCLLFGHDDVIAVKGLGGECLKLSSNPDETGDDDDSDVELKVTGPVHMAALGKGRCRGKDWTLKKWPVIKGHLSPKDCAVECAKRKGCTAFDLSEKQEDGSFECALYGHKNVQPAIGVPGNCYVLSDKPGKLPEGIGAAAVEEEEDDDEEIAVNGPVEFHVVGQGRCRGPAWSTKSWPKVKGSLIAVDCATECAKRKGCTAFDIGVMGEGVEECALYGHKSVSPAAGVPGKCFALGDGPQDDNELESDDEEDEEDDEQIVEDANYKHLGHGMCRGANWQGKKWPVLRGFRTLQECANACKKKKGCTSFDTSSPEGSKFDCMLYGHKNAIPAPGVPGECYSLLGAQYVPEPEESPKAESRAKILDEEDMDYINIKDVELLGKGACRGQGWQAGKWPVMKGRTTLKDCAESCKKAKGCVAFDLSNKEKDKYDCMLLGHPDVLPASALAAKCYIIKGARPVLSTLVDSDSPTVAKIKPDDKYPGSGYGYMKIGSGLCRGVGWQNAEWPIDKGMKTQKDCAQSCDKQRGCQAFDLSNQVGKTFSCLLFNHKSLTVATALPGACYTKTAGNLHTETTADDVEEEEEDVIIDIDGELDLALLGKGGCRGAGWQENGWPKVKGFLSIDECGAKCVGTRGCTAFHTAYPKEGSKKLFECFLFGHKSVVPASGLPGNCYTVSAGSSTIIKTKARKPKSAAKGKKYKIPEFDEPRVVEDSYEEDDDEWLFDPPPAEIRSRDHITQILGLAEKANNEILKATETTLKELKKVYETSIKPLEKMYNYRELSNRHFGDPEIFNKPLIVFLGPWSGGKSTIMNYLLGTEYTKDAFRSTAEPSPGFNFNLAMYGDTAEDVDGTQLSAEWAFSSLQKFGQEFFKKLRGKKLPNKLLEKATLAEIPGVLETGTIRKIDRRYPFNDACQWFIDHADLIVLVYDYAKLDIGPETEALLDQLKGREQQVRILLNKADEITAEELLKIQGNLVWNVSPLMASAEPPTLYAGSFWSQPYKNGAPKRLLKSQEQSLLKDIKEAIDKRVENRIATARRFSVRVRNHAKMVDCYLTTYKNNKGFFGDKKRVAQDIIENPGRYHIYEGISRLTNISRYDLPDPDTYRDFFNVHALYDFETLQSTCTFFKGCPLNKLDIAISYDLPDILNNYKKKVQLALNPPPPPKQKPTPAPSDAKQKNKKK